ncbi:type I secretion system ATPase [Arcobacter nitrofigilis DSM 7299]|uniref:Type I secretion system ATPase n=1 Tax=Arcobacter nitrofigilis (strain ATCC 33309 / DSM 7299 / CCUG 15893 / LMG 7604 / NCTC 12251 / CI) TaxID=572480 RepID=D5V6G3_ARCNC|nr:type I secretion system permease/ATPase [Arcobacter nitrofigilis]ADG94233.1 type I secretion system ATPase [Arcobacter nitrofigilis DSM 7299]
MNNETINELNEMVNNKKIDTLLECLLFLAKYNEREATKDSLISGLAIYDSFMSPKMFEESAKRIGLKTKTVQRKINDISEVVLPATLMLNDSTACVLLEIDFNKKIAKVHLPAVSDGVTTLSIEKLEELYSGFMFLVKPEYNFNNRIKKDVKIDKPKEWFWGVMRLNKNIYKRVVISALLINMFIMATPLFTMNVYDRVLPNNAISTLWVMAIAILVVMVFDFVLKLMRAYFLEIASKKSDVIMSTNIFDQLLNIRLDSKPASTGQFVNRLQSFESVREFFASATIASIVDLPFIILFIIIIFYIGGPVGYVSIFTVFITFGFSYYMQKPIKRSVQQSAKEDQIKQTALTEAVSGLEIIKSVRAQNRMKTYWENSVEKTSHYGKKSHYLSQIVTFFTAFMAQLSNIAIVVIGVYYASEGEMTMGAIIASMMLNGRVIAPVSQFVGMIIRLDRTLLSLENIDEIMKMPVEREANRGYLSRKDLNGDIVFKDVLFSYKGQQFDVLKNINLTIKKGEKIGIIGKIGSGKSTLWKLIMNLYEPTKGSISIDKSDIRQIDPVDLRRSIGCVPQEPFLFMGTIKDNITIGELNASDEDILKASKIAGVHDFLGKHESGYDLIVGERGEGLSGGERQSVTLARAILTNPNIMILDEPTNSMDGQSEEIFKRRIKDIVRDKTLILVTHRPSVLSLVDRLIVMDDGKIIADGPKEEVLKSLSNKAK